MGVCVLLLTVVRLVMKSDPADEASEPPDKD
jgi:hypothetical protein